MEFALIALRQTAVMFLLMGIGWALYRGGKVSRDGSKDLANLLLYVILPCAILHAFCTEYTAEKSRRLFYAFWLSLAALLLAVLVSRLIFRRRPIDHFGAAFSNAGFMGLPMIQAVLGSEAVIYSAPFIALLNFFQWTYGVSVLTGQKGGLTPRKIVTNPILLSLIAGLACFYLRLSLPAVLSAAVSSVAAMNSPVAMIILGVYLAQTDLRSLFTAPRLYGNAAVRLLLIPGLTLALFSLLPASLWEARLALLIAASAPVGANVAVYAQLNHLDYAYASKSVCLSTLFSIGTLPLVIALAGLLWQ